MIFINDVTLRDGSHAVSHQYSANQIATYCKSIDKAGVYIAEVGHGNGIGASSIQVGESLTSDEIMIKTARENLVNTKLGLFSVPGFATIEKDFKPALDLGVDAIKIASHCTEANITRKHIEFCRKRGCLTFGVLMMSHMANKETLYEETNKMEEYGAEGVILMDSAGNYLPNDVEEKVQYLVQRLHIPVGFHAHNNLGMGVANSIIAVQNGATILDGCTGGFGAGAGNAQLEVVIAVLHRLGYATGVDLYKVLDTCETMSKAVISYPVITPTSIISGLSGVVSMFLKPVLRIAKEYILDPRDIFVELGKRNAIVGQEDMIIEIAEKLSKGIK
jgi:4-hydroxy 2-oxovalerate aldolase